MDRRQGFVFELMGSCPRLESPAGATRSRSHAALEAARAADAAALSGRTAELGAERAARAAAAAAAEARGDRASLVGALRSMRNPYQRVSKSLLYALHSVKSAKKVLYYALHSVEQCVRLHIEPESA